MRFGGLIVHLFILAMKNKRVTEQSNRQTVNFALWTRLSWKY